MGAAGIFERLILIHHNRPETRNAGIGPAVPYLSSDVEACYALAVARAFSRAFRRLL